jgi:hypothetical protein
VPLIDPEFADGVVVADEPQVRAAEQSSGTLKGNESLNNLRAESKPPRGRWALGVLHQNVLVSVDDEVSRVIVGFRHLLDNAISYRSA